MGFYHRHGPHHGIEGLPAPAGCGVTTHPHAHGDQAQRPCQRLRRVLHVPYRYAFTFTTALRFVPVFGQEMNAIMEAQTARGVEYDTKNPIKASSCCHCVCHCSSRAWARPMPQPWRQNSAASICVRAPAHYKRYHIKGPGHRRAHRQYRPHRHRLPVPSSPPTATAQRKRPRLTTNEPRPLLFHQIKPTKIQPVPFAGSGWRR